ncbi:MAG: hypothetical protein ACOCQX_02190 [Candidatus Nanoarchaeia archaeon]
MEESRLEKLLKLSSDELKEELKKFPPETRLEVLEKLEEERKKEEEEREALKQEAAEEISLEESFEPPPEESERPSPELSLLEETARSSEEAEQQEESADGVYRVSGLYDELRGIVEDEDRSTESMYRAGEIYNEILKNESYKPEEDIKEIAYGSRKLMKDLMGDYMAQMYKD